MPFKISRDPAIYVAAFAALVQVLAAFFLPLSDTQQTLLNAAAVAVAGVVTAFAVRRDGEAAAALGLAQALIACAIGFGWDASQEQQTALMAAINIGVAMFVRTQATAKVSASGQPQL